MFSLNKILLLDALALVVVLIALLPHAQAAPQQLDGGVYDSPAAQEYWNRRFGKDVLAQARAAAKAFVAQESSSVDVDGTAARTTNTETKTGVVKTAKLRKDNYVPTFAGTYSNPSPLWASRSQPQNP